MATNLTTLQGNVNPSTPNNKTYFIGFNTVGQPNPPYSLINVELIKRDLENAFATPIGSRVMLPTYGTKIFDYLFDPFDETTQNNIINDAINVVGYDPRVTLVSVNVYQEGQALTVAMVLYFQPEAITDNLFVSFTLQNQESF